MVAMLCRVVLAEVSLDSSYGDANIADSRTYPKNKKSVTVLGCSSSAPWLNRDLVQAFRD